MTEKLNEWQKAFKLKGDLRQRDVEKLVTALGGQSYFLLTHNAGGGAKLRSAIEAGWIDTPKCEVGDLWGYKIVDGKARGH